MRSEGRNSVIAVDRRRLPSIRAGAVCGYGTKTRTQSTAAPGYAGGTQFWNPVLEPGKNPVHTRTKKENTHTHIHTHTTNPIVRNAVR